MAQTLARDCARDFDLGALDQIRRAAMSFADTVAHYDPNDREGKDRFIALGVALANVIAMADAPDLRDLRGATFGGRKSVL